MARNSEKRLSGLNRFLEAKETGEPSMERPTTLSSQWHPHREERKAAETFFGELQACIS